MYGEDTNFLQINMEFAFKKVNAHLSFNDSLFDRQNAHFSTSCDCASKWCVLRRDKNSWKIEFSWEYKR